MRAVLRFRTATSAVFLLCIATVVSAPAQTFTTLLGFDETDGAYPFYGPLVQGTDGNLYGTTEGGGGSRGYGSVFEIAFAGGVTTLYSFHGSDGRSPTGGLVQGTDLNFYGTTSSGGSNQRPASGNNAAWHAHEPRYVPGEVRIGTQDGKEAA